MFEYLSGKLASLTAATAVVDCGGVGYLLEISLNTYSAIQTQTEVRLWVHEVVREDAYQLYGFYTPSRTIIDDGEGMMADELTSAIASQDDKMLKRVKGVGAKTAQRIVLELQDKVGSVPSGVVSTAAVSRSKEEALSALVMLGFPKAAADKVLQSLDASLSVEDLIKQALQKL